MHWAPGALGSPSQMFLGKFLPPVSVVSYSAPPVASSAPLVAYSISLVAYSNPPVDSPFLLIGGWYVS